MKTALERFQAWLFCAVALGIGSSLSLAAATADSAASALAKTSKAIPWSQLGVKAGAGYQGDGLAAVRTANGALLNCVFQRLEGEATREGLWLSSTVTNAVNDRFRVVAQGVGRQSCIPGDEVASLTSCARIHPGPPYVGSCKATANTGTVVIDAKTVRFVRPGLVEEYSVSMDGVRQDFVVLERPPGAGELAVRLAVYGAQVEPAAGGARLVLENSGREIAYSRLRVTDATGKDLTARMEVLSVRDEVTSLKSLREKNDKEESLLRSAPASSKRPASALAVIVNDAEAVYPVRIDPTFSDANWVSMGGLAGADEDVDAAVADGSGNLYIGGNFAVVGDVIANGIAKWDGSSWTALGSGLNGGVVALAVSGSDLYAGGQFTTAGGTSATNIAKWDGSRWSALGSGMGGGYAEINGYPGAVYALAVSGSDLYAGGYFTTAGGTSATNIAKWDGSSWSALGSGLNGSVNALGVSGSNLYAAGDFTMAGGSAAYFIAKWDGSSWSALGSGMNNGVRALAVSGRDLYAGGDFTVAGGSAAYFIAKWNGSSWSALGSGMDYGGDYGTFVSALAVSGSSVYAGGRFRTAGGSAANYIAKWNGSSWSALGSGMGGGYEPFTGSPATVSALVVSGSDLYAGGAFTTADGTAAANIAKWNESRWTALGWGLGGGNYPFVSALAVSGSDLYAGGGFTTAGGSATNYISKWNGSSWSALGSGIGGFGYPAAVSALAVSGSNAYAGGYFTTTGGSAANYIARWDGSSWSALGSDLNGGVSALAVSGSDLYAGGGFTTAGGIAANYIAKWNGSSWSALGSGLNGWVSALSVSGSNVYAGGQFTTAGGTAAANIAKWNGSSWTALGSGLGGNYPFVSALAVSGSDLYAGGRFTTAGGSAATGIARWNGSSWTALGSGLGGGYVAFSGYGPFVYALAVSGSDLYAGGVFTTADGSAANYIAKWNGSSWSALGSGMGGGGYGPFVYALAVSGSDLYAGGGFTTAGGNVSAYIAHAYLLPLPELSVLGSGRNVIVSWPSVDTAGFALEQAGTLPAPASWIPNTAGLTDDGTNKSVTFPASSSLQFFRLRRP